MYVVVTDRRWRRLSGAAFSFGRCIMSDALKRAEHYRDLARRYLRLAASTENPNHYLRIAVQYNTLAEAERADIGLPPRVPYRLGCPQVPPRPVRATAKTLSADRVVTALPKPQ